MAPKAMRWAALIGLCALFAVLGILLTPPRGPGSVRRVDHPDPALLESIERAQRGLPEYLKELKHPAAGQRFAVMARFKTPAGNEYLWVKDPQFEGALLSGILDQTPMSAPEHKGDRVSFPTSDVVDWMIRDPDGAIRGKFTESAPKPQP